MSWGFKNVKLEYIDGTIYETDLSGSDGWKWTLAHMAMYDPNEEGIDHEYEEARAEYFGNLFASAPQLAEENARLKAQNAQLLEALIGLREEMLRYRWDTEGDPTITYRTVMNNAQAAIDAAKDGE